MPRGFVPINYCTYAPNNGWFIQTMNAVFFLGGDMMQPDIPNNFLRLLSEGFDSEEEDRQLRRSAVDSYVTLLQGAPATLPQRFLQVISWVLGEYSHLREGLELATVIHLLARLLDQKRTSGETKCWVLTAVTKLCRGPACAAAVRAVCDRHAGSLDTALRQKAQELQRLSQDAELRSRVLLPPDRGPDRLEVDSSLSFLDGFVSEALAAGAVPYKPPHQRQAELAQEKVLSLEPYGLSLPVSLSSCSVTDRQSPTLLSLSSGLSGNSTEHAHKGGPATLKLEGVKRVWGKEGYLAQKKEEAAEETAQVEVPSPLRSSGQQGSTQGPQTPTPEPDPQKQQLASSLFVGLGSQNSVCLMGKAEPTPQRFRKHKGQGSSSGASERSSDSSHSSRSAVDSLLCGNLTDSTGAPFDGVVSATEPTSTEEPGGSSGARVGPLPLLTANGMVAFEPDDGGPEDSRLSPHLPAELSGLSRSDIAPLCSSRSLALSACTVSKEDALLLVVFVSNSSDSAVRQVLLQLTCRELEISCVTAALHEELGGRSVAVCQYSLVMTTPSTHTEVAGTVSYQALPLGEPQTAQFSQRLCLTDFIRPLVLSTEEYGRMWLSFTHNTKQNLKLVQHDQDQDQDQNLLTDQDPLTATLNALKEKLQLHVVDIIGSEGIVACRLLQGQPCLMHCRIHGNVLAAWLRSPVPELPDCLLYHYQKTLQER